LTRRQKKGRSRQKQPYGSLVEINTSRVLVDAVGEDALTEIVDEYLDLLDTSVAIYEKNGNYALSAFASGWCQLLDQASRKLCDSDDNAKALESGRWLCHESHWTKASKVSIETGRPVDVRCSGGRRICAIPVRAGGEIAGAISLAYGDPAKGPQKLVAIAERYGVSLDKLRKHSNSYKPCPLLVIDIAKDHLATLAKLIGAMVERKKIEGRLRESSDRFKLTFENAKDAIFWVNPKTGFIINCNRAAETLLEKRRSEIVGHPQTAIHPPQRIEYYAKMLRAYIEQGEPIREAEVITKSGKIKMAQITAFTVLVEGEPMVQEIFRDVTEHKRVEEELERYSKRLDKMVEEKITELREAERAAAIGEVARVVGYDLRNSLQVITDAIYSAKKKMSLMPSYYRSYAKKMGAYELLGRVEEQVEYVNKIVSDLEDYTTPVKPRLVETRLNQLINETFSTIKIPETVKVSVTLDEDFPQVMVDPRIMKRAFINLIANAIQAMPRGGKIMIGASRKLGAAYITVRDTGVGVPKEILDKLFLPLFTTKPKGTGFGLPICKRIVEGHGGSIMVESKLNLGTTFTVRLPLRR